MYASIWKKLNFIGRVTVWNFVLLVSNNCFPQDEGTSSSEMDNTECSETSSELSNSERSRPEGSKKISPILDKKVSIKKNVSRSIIFVG